MALPASFIRDGYLTAEQAIRPLVDGKPTKSPLRRLMIGTEGITNSGKTEFALSCPGPGLVLCLDRGFDGCLDNPNPPPTRRDDFAFRVVQVPLATQSTQAGYLEYWKVFYQHFLSCIRNPDARTVVIDGDSESYELQRLAELGGLKQIPPLKYDEVNVARRAMYARAWDSGKIIIATNKVKANWTTAYNADGTVKLSKSGEEIREWDGKSYRRQGFPDQDYLWHIQLRHLFKPPNTWGIQILKCKADPSLLGFELWGEDCCFESLVQTCYPNVPLSEWGL